ncbi:MAG TPA: DegT/DnrJ/EryC1/StrS family aminotransferase [Bryobacteraceae bacterium]
MTREALPHFLHANGRTFGKEEEQLVLEALRSGCLSRTGGSLVKQLEREFAGMLDLPFAVACSSGTAAVHLCISALCLEPGDEVIVPPITDIGTILPILWQNAVPVFADVEPFTMTLDPTDVSRRITGKTRAIIAVHLAGQMCEMESLRKLADEEKLALIEDCSQAYWAEYKGNLAGTLGDIACFSLQQSKHVTCGEGGLMVTRNREFARTAGLFADKAWPRDINSLGSGRFLFLAQNYRMSELQGAVALAQIRKIQAIVSRRRETAGLLTSLLTPLNAVNTPRIPSYTKHSYWLYMLRINTPEGGARTQKIGDALVEQGIPAWVRYIVDPLYLSPLFTQPATYGMSGYPFREYGGQRFERGLCPQAEAVLDSTIAIHWNENFTDEHVEGIAAAIRQAAWQ